MRYLLATILFFFAVVPVNTQALVAPVSIEQAEAPEIRSIGSDELKTEPALYIHALELYPSGVLERPVRYVGTLPPLLWRPPMTSIST